MSILRVATIEPEGATTTLTLGASGDTVTSSADSIKANTFKDAGGNTIFTSNGSGTLSSINSALKGGMNFISSQTASNAASIEFTTGIDSTYNEYIFVMTDIVAATDEKIFSFQMNAVGQTGFNETITSTMYWARHRENNTAADMGYQGYNDQAQGTAYQMFVNGLGNESDQNSGIILHIFNPASTTYVKNFYATGNSMYGSAGSGNARTSINFFLAGYFNTTAALDEISFKMDAGNMYGTIAMYGTG